VRRSRDAGQCQYTFVAIDAQTKPIRHFDVDKRDVTTAYRFMEGLKSQIGGRFQLTTKGFAPYIGAVDGAWGADAPDYA
jgi:transposase-like protein